LNRLAGEKLCLELVGDTDVSQRKDNLLVDWQQLLFFITEKNVTQKPEKFCILQALKNL
jgi:hypothetical protein